MRVEWAVPCRYAEVHDNLFTIVGAGLDHMYPPTFPIQLQVILAVRLSGMADELGEENTHAMSAAIIDGDDKRLGEAGGDVTFPGSALRPEWLVGIHLPVALQFEAPAPGTYQIEVRIDDHSHHQPLHVYSPPEGEDA